MRRELTATRLNMTISEISEQPVDSLAQAKAPWKPTSLSARCMMMNVVMV